jgi:hypothetical protein
VEEGNENELPCQPSEFTKLGKNESVLLLKSIKTDCNEHHRKSAVENVKTERNLTF